MKNRFIALLAALALLCSLPACGAGTADADAPQTCSSLEELATAAGFAVTLLPMEATEGYSSVLSGASLTGYSVINGTIAVTDYDYQGTTVELRMSLTKSDFSGLSGYEDGQTAGGVQITDSRFSSLNVCLSSGVYYCEFSFDAEDETRYYSLSRSDTDFDGYVDVLQVLITTLQLETSEAEANA